MKTEILTLCDSAQEYLGKTVIMGTFNEFKSTVFPTLIQNVSLVIRIAFNHDEDVNAELNIRAYNIKEPEYLIINFNTPFTNKPNSNGKRSFANAILKLDGLQIPKPGTYVFEIKIGDWSDNIELYADTI